MFEISLSWTCTIANTDTAFDNRKTSLLKPLMLRENAFVCFNNHVSAVQNHWPWSWLKLLLETVGPLIKQVVKPSNKMTAQILRKQNLPDTTFHFGQMPSSARQ